MDVRGSSPLSPTSTGLAARAKVAQLVELTTENRAVGSSSLPLGTTHCRSPTSGRCRLTGFRAFDDRELRPLSPFIPGAIVVRPGLVADAVQGKQDGGRGHAPVAVGNDWHVSPHATLLEDLAQLLVRLPGAVVVDERLRPDVDGGRHMTAPSTPPDRPRVLRRVPRIDDDA